MKHHPLAYLIRPKTLNDFIGQENIWHPQSPLWKLTHSGKFYSLIFWGPPGSGKTTLAYLTGTHLNVPFVELSCVSAGVKEIRNAIADSEMRIDHGQTPGIVFLDEIHRLSKNQQDVLLPALEKGDIKMIGATTENPSFQVNKAILSRSLTFAFQSHSKKDIISVLKKAASQYGELRSREEIHIKTEVFDLIAESCEGDARAAVNLFEAILESISIPSDVSVERIKSLGFEKLRKASYDAKGEDHYDIISAFIKSLRASHPDAALHYLARMIDAGEDPLFIARRLVIFASEDVGNASPTALIAASAALQALTHIGLPEGRIILAQITTLLASSPKSNRSYVAIDQALADLKKKGTASVPLHLRNAPTKLMKELAYGEGYIYPHDNQDYKNLTYLPEGFRGVRYYKPLAMGSEAQLIEHLKKLRPTKD